MAVRTIASEGIDYKWVPKVLEHRPLAEITPYIFGN